MELHRITDLTVEYLTQLIEESVSAGRLDTAVNDVGLLVAVDVPDDQTMAYDVGHEDRTFLYIMEAIMAKAIKSGSGMIIPLTPPPHGGFQL